MEFFKFLSNTSPEKTERIVLLSLIYGVTGGILPPLVIQGVKHIMSGEHYLLYMIWLPITVTAMMLSAHIAKKETARVTEEGLEQITLQIANRIRQTELPVFEQLNQAEIYMGIVEARNVTAAVTRSIEIAQNLLILFTAWVYIIWRSRLAGVVFLATWLLIQLVYEVYRKIGQNLFRQVAQTESLLFGMFRHFLEGFKEIKLFRRKNDDLFHNYLMPVIRKTQQNRYFSVLWTTDFGLFVTACIYIALAIQAFLFASRYTSDLAIELLVIGLYFIKPTWLILFSLPFVTRGQAALERVKRLAGERLGQTELEEELYNPAQEILQRFQSIAFQDVTFTYQEVGATPGFSIGPLSLTVNVGELLFIAGGNGSGKSTFIKIVTGLYAPDSGDVTIDGIEVKLANHRYLFSTIFTDFHLFDALYGVDEVDRQEMDHLLKQMELADKTSCEANRFTTLDLSTGQRKRLALVVALLEDKPVYVFDEWAADQDPHFRKYFYETLLPALKTKGKTVIVVTHDDAYYHLADRVVTMEEGRISDTWSPRTEAARGPFKIGIPASVKKSFPPPAEKKADQKHPREESTAASTEPVADDTARAAYDPDAPFFQRKLLMKRLYWLTFLTIIDSICNAIRLNVLFGLVTLTVESSRVRSLMLYLVALLLGLIATRQFRTSLTKLSEELIATIRIRIVERLRNTGLASFERLGAERLYTALTTDLRAVSEVSLIFSFTLSLGIRSITLLMYLATVSLPIFLVEIGMLGVAGIIYGYNQMRIQQTVEQVRGEETRLFEAITHLLEGFKELRINNHKSDAFFAERLSAAAVHVKQSQLQAMKYFIINFTLVYGTWMWSLALLPLILPFIGKTGVHTLVSAIGIILMIPMNVLVEAVPQMFLAGISLRRLFKLEHSLQTLEPEPDEVAEKARLLPFESLHYRDLAFQYRDAGDYPFAVGPVRFDLQAGERLFVVGGNGSGKTTLLKLLTGLYMADSGQIALNHQAVDVRRHRYLFSAVFSDFHLFDRLYGVEHVDAQRVNDLLTLMQLDQKVQFVNGKFSTLDLSTGQRKRLAMVIAMMEDHPILIFDEWAAGQDPHFRHYFYETLLPLFKTQGKTVFAITHDERYFAFAERIVKMEYGNIVAGETA